MARVPNAPTPRSHRAIHADSILSWAAINPHQPLLDQPSLAPKKPDPHQPLTNRLQQSGAHETAISAGDWRPSGSTTANRKLQR
ncbi:hypothetical protein QBC32DRAFT_172224, partial [Pseudoneurospora amorphoporcata]